MKVYKIKFRNPDTIPFKDWMKIADYSLNSIMIDPVDEESPSCWDASFSIEGEKIIITGAVSAGGYGSVEISFPWKDVENFYKIYVEIEDVICCWYVKTTLEMYGYDLEEIPY